MAAAAVFACVLIASLAVAVAPAAAQPVGGELPIYSGPLQFPPIESSSDPEDYSWRVELVAGETLTLVSEEEALIERSDGTSEQVWAQEADDADHTVVPTTLSVSEGDVITMTVHHREGAFVYPVTESPWLLIRQGSSRVEPFPAGELERAERVIEEANPYIPHYERKTAPTAPGPGCHVPKLSGLTRSAAATKLRAAHCSIGKVHLAAGATAGRGKVVKQFRAAGTELAAGAPVAVKLGSR